MNEEARKNVEVERKFLVRGREWDKLGQAESLHQGYLNTHKDRTVRVRIIGDKGIFTVKGRTIDNEKPEIEAEIPVDKVKTILEHPANLCMGHPIEKTRRAIKVGDLTWEVDEFFGENQGLVVAEVEYKGPESGKDAWNRKVDTERPSWIGDEVSRKWEYYNSNLTEKPFTEWPEEMKAAMLRHASG